MFTEANQTRPPLDLPQLVSDALSQSPNATRNELERALINGVETSVGRLLDEHERNQIAVELYGQWNEREESSGDLYDEEPAQAVVS